MEFVKRIYKNYPIPFIFWYYGYRKHKGVKISWFTRKTRLFVDGFPRSGNTFIIHLLRKNLLNRDEIVDHFHKIAGIKVAIFLNLPVFLLIRKPEDAITSYYLKHFALKKQNIPENINVELLKNLSKEYYIFYQYVNKNIPSKNIIHFDDLIQYPEHVLTRIANQISPKPNRTRFTRNEIEPSIQSYRGAQDTYGSSKPNEEKEQLKDELKRNIRDIDDFQYCKDVYEKINYNKY